MVAPCKDCPDRHTLCHMECPRYAEYRADREHYHRERRFDRDIDNLIYEKTVRKRAEWAMKKKRQG